MKNDSESKKYPDRRGNAVVIIHRDGDQLSESVANHLSQEQVTVRQYKPESVGDLQIKLCNNTFCINGVKVKGIFFRVSPNENFSYHFRKQDQSFIDTEIRSIWLSAFHCDSVLAINDYDAISWFEGIEWYQWRRRLIQKNIPVSPFSFGKMNFNKSKYWYPYASNASRPVPNSNTCKILGAPKTNSISCKKSFAVDGEIISGPGSPIINSTAQTLSDLGIYIAEIHSDEEGHILKVETQPHPEKKIRDLVSHKIKETFCEFV